MKWQQVAVILTAILIGGGVITYTDLFGALFNLTGVEATYTGDSYCAEECESYINVTTSYWRICFAHYDETKYQDKTLFKKSNRGRTLHVNLDKVDNIISTFPRVKVDWLVPARGAGNWRPIKDGDCWERKKINQIKLVGHKDLDETIKWNFNVDKYISIDPLWISSLDAVSFEKDACVEYRDFVYTESIPIDEIILKNGSIETIYEYKDITEERCVEYADVFTTAKDDYTQKEIQDYISEDDENIIFTSYLDPGDAQGKGGSICKFNTITKEISCTGHRDKLLKSKVEGLI